MATGIINAAMTPGANGTPTAGYTAAQVAGPTAWNVDDNQTVAGQLAKNLDPNGGLIQQARTGALAQMNDRGLSNSSLALTAGDSAAYGVAMPIAQADAATYGKSAAYNADQQNQVNALNVNSQNSAANTNVGAANTYTGQKLAADTSIANTGSQNQTQLAATNINAATSRANTTDTNATQLQTNAASNATQLATTGINAATSRANAIGSDQTQLATTGINAATSRANTQDTNATSVANTGVNAATSIANTGVNAATSLQNSQIAADTSRANAQLQALTQTTINGLDNANKVTLQNLQSQNQQLLQTSTTASSMFTSYMNQLQQITASTTMDAGAKEQAAANAIGELKQGLAVAGHLSGADLSQYFNQAPPPQSNPTPGQTLHQPSPDGVPSVWKNLDRGYNGGQYTGTEGAV